MTFLDMKTVFTGYVLSAALGAAVMASLWLQNRKRSPGMTLWLVDYVMQFIALVLILLRGLVPDLFSMVVANVLIVGGTILLYQGLGRYVGKETRQLHNYVFLAVFTAVHLYFTFVVPSLPIRTINASIGLLFVCAQAAWLMLRTVDSDLRPATRASGIVFVALCVVSMVHVIINVFQPSVTDLFRSGVLDAGTILAYQLLYTALTFALFLLVSHRLLGALELDVAERKDAEAALGLSEEKFSVAFQNVPDAIIITLISDGTIIEANESCFELTGFSKEDMIGKTTIDLGLWGNLRDREHFVELLELHGRVANFECPFVKKSGEEFPSTISGEIIEVGGRTLVLTVVHDATERRLAEDRLRELSQRDPLTGLLNLRAFYAVAAERLAAEKDSRVALVYMDVDGLKGINDAHGHPMGDQALMAFATVLRSAFRESDILGRLGGDEFAVLAISRENVPDEALMLRFATALRDRNTTDGLPFRISASFGVAWRDPVTQSPDLQGLISVADARMYQAKRVLYSSLQEVSPNPAPDLSL